MATAAMAGAAGAAVVMYYTARTYNTSGEGTSEEREGDLFVGGIARDIGKRRVVVPIIARAPSTWFESLSTISETLRFTYSETLGKWPIGDLAFGINYLLRQQGNEHVAEAFINEESEQIDGLNIMVELQEYLRVLVLCMHFSKKPFPNFLEAIGFKSNQVLLEEGKAGILKPAFTVLLDHEHNCVLLLIRGTHSVKDTLTSLTGAVVPFHHTIFGKDGVNKLILGYAHCGMVAAARWIAAKASKKIIEALKENPTYKLKIVGHSLGGGTAALLSYILREQNICTNICCICFGPAACMTRELAESGSEFVITIINGCDLVPCFSSGSLDDLRAEVTASAWVNDFREQIERTRILRTMFRSASALKCRLQTIANISRASVPASSMMVSRAAQTGIAGVGAIWRPMSNGTRVQDELEQLEEPISPNSGIEEIGEDLLWHQVAQELERQQQLAEVETQRVREEEEEVAKEIIKEEENVVCTVATEIEKDKAKSAVRIDNMRHFFPPGRIMHLVGPRPVKLENQIEDFEPQGQQTSLYFTKRYLYGKIRLSKTMVHDHYMPTYKRVIESIIEQLEIEIPKLANPMKYSLFNPF
ncbi:hypothetical protein M758_4G140700 [Ceratodon purpureus]|nr:hypothetical protein M758_4G140700 [Ceratodon purpureus]